MNLEGVIWLVDITVPRLGQIKGDLNILFVIFTHYPMTWIGTTRILYDGILRCRDLPSVAMSILLLLVTSTMVS